MRSVIKIGTIYLVILLVSVSCSVQKTYPPQTVLGTLAAKNSTVELSNVTVYLKAANEDGVPPFTLLVDPGSDTSIINAKTDETATFILLNVPVGRYYLVYWTPFGWKMIFDGEQPMIIELDNDESINLGIIRIDWP
ncbi:MAG TPA: hypothetical protein PK299_10315 [Anaerolineales bacterium]|nr:hypothetical protein [Anaerolineales bacterium]